MIGWTLAIYFARRFTRTVLAIFMLFVILIAAATYIDVIDRAFSSDNFKTGQAALVVLLRLPSYSEDALPFAVLFGSIAAFVTTNRLLEVVVARAAGLSGWQFLLPATVAGLILGVLATTVYSPISSFLLSEANSIKARGFLDIGQMFGGKEGTLWIRQTGGGRDSIISAAGSYDNGLGLTGVTVFVFDKDNSFIERVDAKQATYSTGEWDIANATVTSPNQPPRETALYKLPTALGPDQIRQTFEVPKNISFWALPGMIANAERAGVSSASYELRYHALLARPILLLAMVLIAAIVSLRFSRSQRVGRMILAGAAVGFVLYVVTSVANDLGGGGIVSPPLAAWLPAVVAILAGMTVLLHLEDG